MSLFFINTLKKCRTDLIKVFLSTEFFATMIPFHYSGCCGYEEEKAVFTSERLIL